MRVANYARGAERERQLVKLLREEGWVATRTAGSHGAFDVVGLKRGCTPRLVQLKCGGRRWPSRGERARLSVDAARAGAEAWIVFWEARRGPEWVPEHAWPR